jgi:hypothetical protein
MKLGKGVQGVCMFFFQLFSNFNAVYKSHKGPAKAESTFQERKVAKSVQHVLRSKAPQRDGSRPKGRIHGHKYCNERKDDKGSMHIEEAHIHTHSNEKS